MESSCSSILADLKIFATKPLRCKALSSFTVQSITKGRGVIFLDVWQGSSGRFELTIGVKANLPKTARYFVIVQIKSSGRGVIILDV